MASRTTTIVDHAPLTRAAIFAAYEQRAAAAAPCSDEDWRRDHMGASIIGHQCDRYLWLSFRWAAAENVEGRMLRLFETGKREESRVIENLRAIGCTVHDADDHGEQFRIAFADGHGGGSADCIIEGLPDGKEPTLGEIKTCNAKGFARLQEKGLRSAKPEHYTQMQLYMLHLGLDRGLYIAVCKDTDDIYLERIKRDDAHAGTQTGKALQIIQMAEPPAKLDKDFPPCVYVSKDGTRWPCKFYSLCHEQQMPERNCRTCISSTPVAEGKWSCDIHGELQPDIQRSGCADQCSIPSIVNAQVVSVEGRKVTYSFGGGAEVAE